MPEPALDLDRAFDDLTRDVTAVSHGRRAAGAIRTARRRRVAAASVAVAALAAGAALVVPLVPGGDDPGGDRIVADRGAVEPAPLTPRALTGATTPWAGGWTGRDSDVSTDAPCLSEEVPPPDAGDAATELRSSPEVGASLVYGRWQRTSTADTAYREITRGFASCADVEMAVTEVDVPGAEVTTWSYPAAYGIEGVVWVAVTEDRVGLLTIAGVDDPPDDVLAEVARALVAGVTFDDWAG